MGAVSRDLYRKGREYDESYPYEVTGIAALLRGIYRLTESRTYDGDIDATTLLIDLKMALDSNCLTPRMRQVIALYYFTQFTEEETAEVLNIQQRSVNYSLESALERIASHMEYGYTKRTNARTNAIVSGGYEIRYWINEVACGKPVYEINDEVISAINLWRVARLKDAKDREAILQRYNAFTYLPVYENDEVKYPALTWDQIKWRDRRISYVSEIKYDDRLVKVGFKNTAIINGDDEWVYPRQRLFARKN